MPLLSSKKVKHRYQLKERLGTGGMGVVYRARDVVINADVALKTLSDITDPIALRMFREECDKLAKIVHPNVVEIRDVGEIEEGRARKPYMVMPFLRGKTLDRLLLDSPDGMPVERAFEILVQASRGLQATHEAGLIHRDIKPSNIFVLDDDSVKLIDFGVAQYAENLLTVTRKGTLMYMAPEQVMMQAISPLSDIFSLGVVAYEILTGRRPFEGRTEKDLIEKIVHRNPPRASCFNSQLNFAVDQTLQKALAKLPEHRFQSAREFGETLRKAVLNQRITIFDPARNEPRIEQARNLIFRGDLAQAGERLKQLELEGWLDDRITEAKQDLERLCNKRAVSSLLASARSRIEAKEYELAAENVDDALQLEPQNADASFLREEIERSIAARDVGARLSTARQLAANREFAGAKELVEQALEIRPNDSAALELRCGIQQDEQEHKAVLNEKRRFICRAEQASIHCDPERAQEAIQRALELDRQAPEPGDTATNLLGLSNRIVSASQDVQNALQRARELYSSGDLDAALACCDDALATLPEHTGLRALKLDIEEAQREQTDQFIAATRREIEAEPDLDRRIELLRSASERFAEIEHFGWSYRVACRKRDFAESLAAKARGAEEDCHLRDALDTWNVVRAVHPRYPNVEAEISRLERRNDLETDYELREDLLHQIKAAVEAQEFGGALHLIRTGARAFAADPAFSALCAAAEEGAQRERLAGHLLDESAELAQRRLYADALAKLDEANVIAVRKREIVAMRRHILVQQAQSLFATDWRRAKALLKQALELGPPTATVNKLLEALEERDRRERLNEATSRIRQLERTHNFDGALHAAEVALAENPEDLELAQTTARLRRRAKRQVQQPGQPSSGVDTPGRAFLRAAWDKASAIAHRSPPRRARAARPSMSAWPVRSQELHGGSIAFAEKTPSSAAAVSTPRPEIRATGRGSRPQFRVNGVLLAFVAGTVAAAILLAFMLPRRRTPIPVLPHPVPIVIHKVETAKLAVHLDPADAQVSIDGSSASLINGTLQVQPGTHLIEARSPGYQPFSRSMEVSPNSNVPLDIVLAPIPLSPAIHIETDLQSGSVLMDGNRIGALDGGQFSEDASAGPHTIAILASSGGRYSFAFTLGQNPVWTVEPPKSTAYGTPVLVALSGTAARVLCGRPGLSFELDSGQSVTCTAAGKDLPALSNGTHTLTLLEKSRTIAVHTLDYQGSPLLAALITTGAQFGGLAIQGTEATFDVSVNGYTSKRPPTQGHWRRLLKPGDYTIVVSKPGFTANPSTLNVSVAPGVDTLEQVSFTPVPEHAHLRLQSQPGTEVNLNGKAAGTVPESGILDVPQLAAGPTELHLHHKGFADAQQTITLGNGDNQRTIFLQELKAKITFDVDPPNTQLTYSLQGNSLRHPLTGSTIELPPGTYNFEASAPGHVTATSVVPVAAGETKTITLRLSAAHPTTRNLDVWPGWELQSGWLTRDKPGPIFLSLPDHTSRLAFSARWERQKTIVHWSAGSLNLVFRTADNARTVGFRITDHGVSWTVAAQGQRQEGRFRLNPGKNPETIQADIRPSGIALTINGAALAAVGPNLAGESKPLQFGFIIDPDEIVRLTALRVLLQSTNE